MSGFRDCGNVTSERREAMNDRFMQHLHFLQPAFEKLMSMAPVTAAALPKQTPTRCVYLFAENRKHFYVGRTRNFRQRKAQHSLPGSPYNQASFAFTLALEKTGKTTPTYKPEGSRSSLAKDPEVFRQFGAEKERVRGMELRYVDESDGRRQTLLAGC